MYACKKKKKTAKLEKGNGGCGQNWGGWEVKQVSRSRLLLTWQSRGLGQAGRKPMQLGSLSPADKIKTNNRKVFPLELTGSVSLRWDPVDTTLHNLQALSLSQLYQRCSWEASLAGWTRRLVVGKHPHQKLRLSTVTQKEREESYVHQLGSLPEGQH